MAWRCTPFRILSCLFSFFCSVYVSFSVRCYRRQEKIKQPSADAVSLQGFNDLDPISLSFVSKLRDVEEMSSIDYMACCGLGHRLSKMADAHYIANHLGFALRGYWGYCNEVEVFNFLFGPQPIPELLNITEFGSYARINNDAPGFIKLQRRGSVECMCSDEKILQDSIFYKGLRDRFSAKDQVDKFVKQHFTPNVTAIGIHIRAGNGEQGDFKRRGRTIGDTREWVKGVASRLLENNWGSSILFVATDTPSMINDLARLLRGKIPVVYFDQTRLDSGSGVLFGEMGKVIREGQMCLTGWENSLTDMMILSHVDVLIAGRPSSFIQSLPLSLLFTKTKRKAKRQYCELNQKADEIRCYNSIQDWCCVGKTDFSLAGIQQHEYLRVPIRSFDKVKFNVKVRDYNECIPRPEGNKQVCLPYDFSDYTGGGSRVAFPRAPPRRRRPVSKR